MSARLEPAVAAELLITALAQDIPLTDLTVNELLKISRRLEPAQATRICGQAARILVDALARDIGSGTLENNLAALSARLEPAQAARVWNEVAQILATKGSTFRLGRMASRLDPAESARICGQAVRNVVAALEGEKDFIAWVPSSDALESVASRIDPAQAARICSQLARRLIPYIERIPWTDNRGMPDYSSFREWVSFLSSRMDPTEAGPMLASALEGAENSTVRHELALSLSSVAVRLDLAEGAGLCRKAANVLVAALEREPKSHARTLLAEGFVSVVGRLNSTEAAKVCGQAAEVLALTLQQTKERDVCVSLAIALRKVSARLEPAEAARLCGTAACTLVTELAREKDTNDRANLARGIVSLAGLEDQSEVSSALVDALNYESNDNRLASDLASLAARSDPAVAARVYGQAARVLASRLKLEKHNNTRQSSASGLASLAGRLVPAETARIYSEAARVLADALAREKNEQNGLERMMDPVSWSTDALSSVLARMAPADSVHVLTAALKQALKPAALRELARLLSDAMNRLDAAEAQKICDHLIGSLDRDFRDSIASELLPHLDPGSAHKVAWDLASRMCSEPVLDSDTFSEILTDTSREQMAPRKARLALAVLGLKGTLDSAVSYSAEPFPCRLTTQELVELLKMPTCFGEARRVVLDHLGNRYGRHFVNHWAFVRFATEQKLGLEFTAPPKRPDRRVSLERVRLRKRTDSGRPWVTPRVTPARGVPF
jgi:hypothetical protein